MEDKIKNIVDEEILYINKEYKTFDDILQHNKRKEMNYVKLIKYLNSIRQ